MNRTQQYSEPFLQFLSTRYRYTSPQKAHLGRVTNHDFLRSLSGLSDGRVLVQIFLIFLTAVRRSCANWSRERPQPVIDRSIIAGHHYGWSRSTPSCATYDMTVTLYGSTVVTQSVTLRWIIALKSTMVKHELFCVSLYIIGLGKTVHCMATVAFILRHVLRAYRLPVIQVEAVKKFKSFSV